MNKLYYTHKIFSSIIVMFYFFFQLPAQKNNTLRLHPENPHYFLYQNKPTVIVGSGEHYGAVMNLDFNYDIYLKTLQSDGLNTTRLFMGAYYEKLGAFGIEKNTLAPKEERLLLPWKKVNDKYDLNSWNEAYFIRLHDFMKKAFQAAVIVEVNLFSAYYGAGWAYHPFHGNNNLNGTPTDLSPNRANTLHNGSIQKFQEAYTRKLVRELNQYNNLFFEIQNEPWAEDKDTILVWNDYLGKDELKEPGNNWKNTLEIATLYSKEWHKAVSRWIVSEEKPLPKKHLISHNIANFKLPIFVTDPNISIYTFHYAHPEVVTMNYHVNKVIGFNETGFAGKNDDTYRRQAWRFMMNGGGLFGHLDYSFSLGNEDGTDTTNKAPGGGSPALRKYFSILKNYLQGLQLATLKPDKSFLGHVEGAFVYSMKDAQSRVIYLEPISSKPVKINLQLPAGNYLIEWTDVLTGKKIKTEKVKFTNKQDLIISPEGINDKVVKFRKI